MGLVVVALDRNTNIGYKNEKKSINMNQLRRNFESIKMRFQHASLKKMSHIFVRYSKICITIHTFHVVELKLVYR